MNFEQVKGIIERIATLVFAYLVGKGVISQGMVGDLMIIVTAVASIAWGWYVNTPRALDSAARNVS